MQSAECRILKTNRHKVNRFFDCFYKKRSRKNATSFFVYIYAYAIAIKQTIVPKSAGMLSRSPETRTMLNHSKTVFNIDGRSIAELKSTIDNGKINNDNAIGIISKNVAKEHELLLVPSSSFGVKGYVRISYCVATDVIKNAMPAFEKLMKHYKGE